MLDFAALFHHSQDIGFMTDARGAILAATRGAERLLGYSQTELVGLDLVHLDAGSDLRGFFASARARMRLSFKLRDRSGRACSIESVASGLRDAAGAPMGWFFMGQDLRSAVVEARGERTILDALIDSVDAALWSFDSGGKVVMWTAACERSFGYPRTEAEGKMPAVRLFSSPEEYRRIVAAVDAQGRFSGEVLLLSADGASRLYHLAVTRLALRGEAAVGYSCVSFDITERRRTEELFRALFEKASEGVFLVEDEGLRVIEANEETCRLLGYTREELLRLTVPDIVPPDLRHRITGVRASLTPAAPTRRDRRFLLRKDGSRIAVDHTITRLEISGRVLYLASARDVSEEQRTEELSRVIFQKASDGMFLVDFADFRILEANEEACRSTGFSREDFLSMRVPDLMANPEKVGLEEYRRKLLAEGGPVLLRSDRRRKDGTTFPGEARIARIDLGGRPFGLGSVRDVTRQVEAERELQEAKAFLELIMDGASDGVAVFDERGVYVTVNRKLLEMRGNRREDLVGHSFEERTEPGDLENYRALFAKLLRGEPVRMRTTVKSPDRGPIPVDVNSTLVSVGGRRYVVALIREIAEQVRAEEALQRAKANLERRVEERTAELRKAHDELEQRVEERTSELAWANQLLKREIQERTRTSEDLKLFREIFAHASEGICLLDPQGAVLAQNRAHREMLEFPDEDLVGKAPEFFAPERLDSAGRFHEERTVHTRTGAILRVELSAFTVRNASGGILCHVVIQRDITKRKEAEEALASIVRALRESEERWRSLVSQAPGLIVTVDREGVMQSVNRVLPGFRMEEVVGRRIYDFVPPESLETMRKALDHVFRTGEPTQYEIQGQGTGGKLAWYHSQVGPVRVGEEVTAAIIISTDVTERKVAQEKLAALAEERKLILENTRDFVYRHDASGVMTYLSPAVEQVTGHSLQEWLTHYTEFLTDNPINRKVIEYTEETLRTGKQHPPYLVEIYANDRRRLLLELHERAIWENGKVTGIVGMARDVTERLRAEEVLAFQKTLLESQTEAAIEGILVVSPEGKMLSFNRRFVEMWGIPGDVVASRSDEAALQAVIEKLADPQGFLARVRELYEHPDEKSQDEIQLKDGRTFDRYSSPIRSAEGVLYGRVWYFRDITGRKRTEEELRRAAEETRKAYNDLQQTQAQLIRSEKLASIGMLVSGVAHEINNPLNVMFGNLSLLEEACRELSPLAKAGARTKKVRGVEARLRRFKGMIRDALKAAKHARGVVDDFRGFARDVRTAERVDLNACLEETLALVQRGLPPGVRIVKRLGRIPSVRCMRGQMTQVFLNLMTNATEAIGKKGILTLRTGRRDGQVVVEVADTGHGMSEEVRKKIFEPFFTTKPVGRGLGLGLSISATIINNHGGQISVKSHPGRGSVFRIELPVKS